MRRQVVNNRHTRTTKHTTRRIGKTCDDYVRSSLGGFVIIRVFGRDPK